MDEISIQQVIQQVAAIVTSAGKLRDNLADGTGTLQDVSDALDDFPDVPLDGRVCVDMAQGCERAAMQRLSDCRTPLTAYANNLAL